MPEPVATTRSDPAEEPLEPISATDAVTLTTRRCAGCGATIPAESVVSYRARPHPRRRDGADRGLSGS
jgi:hypothetical protein